LGHDSSADYIDGTKDIKNPAFHRSIPLDSVKFLEAEKYDGPWSDGALIGKKVVRYQGGSEEFTPKSAKNYNTKVYKAKLANEAKVISEMGAQYTKTAPAVVGLLKWKTDRLFRILLMNRLKKIRLRNYSLQFL
jgi:hypothetical protein